MIYYQLPNGKGVYITIDQLLELTDADIQYLIANNSGSYTGNNPFINIDHDFKSNDDPIEPDSPDMLSDGDDDPHKDIDINNIIDN